MYSGRVNITIPKGRKSGGQKDQMKASLKTSRANVSPVAAHLVRSQAVVRSEN